MINEELTFNTTMSEEERKEEELMNTMKMEPILERTIIEEEPLITIKKKRIKITDYFLIGMISVLSVVFVVVLFNVL